VTDTNPEVVLLDGEDVDANGPPAPDGDQLTDAEVAAIRASRADPATSPADAEAN
jgi:hypothetical protein